MRCKAIRYDDTLAGLEQGCCQGRVMGVYERCFHLLLEDQRLVRRRHDEMNRRLVYIAVTPAGRELVQAVTLEAARQFLPGLAALSPRERRRLEESLHTLDTLLHKAGCHTW